MDFNRLRYFHAITQTKNIRKAAAILGISPPALAKAIRVLEGEVGAALIAPSGRGIALTAQGKSLGALIPELLEHVERVRAQATEREWSTRGAVPLRMGAFEVFSTWSISHLASLLPDRTELSVYEMGPGEIEEGILSGGLDYGLTYFPMPRAGLEYVRVGALKMGVFGLPRFAQEKSVGLDGLPFVVPATPPGKAPNRAHGLDGWPEQEIPRQVAYRVELMESGLQLCRAGHAVIYMPTFIAKIHNEHVRGDYQLVEIRNAKIQKLPRIERQEVWLVKPKGQIEDSRMRLLAKFVRMVSG